MRILVYFGHPSQYLFLRESIKRLKNNGHKFEILIKTKDVLHDLLLNDGLKDFKNILFEKRGNSIFSIIFSYLKRLVKIFFIIKKFKPDLLIGTDPTIAQVGFFLGIDRITTIEDDYEIIKPLAWMTYPFTQTIVCPKVCKVGMWGNKKIGYEGYMKLGYLHPNVFKLEKNIKEKYSLPEKFVILRLSGLNAYHDIGVDGINRKTLDQIINILNIKNINIFISSEEKLDKKHDKFRLNILPNDIHHILSLSMFLISDSQSMTVEAAVIGVPSIRFSSFSGKISVLEELEKKYSLTYGLKTNDAENLFKHIDYLLKVPNLKDVWEAKLKSMLSEKIDVTSFLIWFFENYPASNAVIKNNANFQKRFL